jgi:hypothetical protein
VTRWTVSGSIPGVAKKVLTTMSGLAPNLQIIEYRGKAA